MQSDSRGATDTGISTLIRISIAGDWATGTEEADEIASHIRSFKPHYTIHLGDIYYVGDAEEVNENCLGKSDADEIIRSVTWPHGSVGSFALNGNHEMYANGNAYFELFLPALGVVSSDDGRRYGQKASFFCLQNEFWKIIALDTGYNSLGFPLLEHIPGLRQLPGIAPTCRLPKASLEWLRKNVSKTNDRGVVLLTHHQYFSAFEEGYPLPARQLSEFIKSPVLWFWGHEHRFAIYDKYATEGGIEAYGRCIGHGGFPVARAASITNPEPPLLLYDNRKYATVEGAELGFNGFANLTFQARKLSIDYRDLHNQLLFEETWETNKGALQLVSTQVHCQDLSLTNSRNMVGRKSL